MDLLMTDNGKNVKNRTAAFVSSLHLYNAKCQLFTTDSVLLPLWDWAGCVYQSLMYCCSFTMTCPVLFVSILEPCVCRGFLQHYTLSYQICFFCFFWVACMLAYISTRLMYLSNFKDSFFGNAANVKDESKQHQWLCLCCKNDELVQLKSARGENKVSQC